MLRHSGLLTTLRGEDKLLLNLAALPPRLVPIVGTLAVSGGALRAATANDWLKNVCVNDEMSSSVIGWGGARATLSRVDSEVDPGANSGGADKWCLKMVATTDSSFTSYIYQTPIPTIVPSATYRVAARIYIPSANASKTVSLNDLFCVVSFATMTDIWTACSTIGIANAGVGVGVRFDIHPSTKAIGDTFYIDKIECRRQNAPALIAGWPSPNFVATLGHVSPASGVTPFSLLLRYTDALNYWEIRVTPNTTGNDLQIVQVTAGAETVRAEADVDWTSGSTDQLEVSALGAVISTRYKKSGGSWTNGPSYTAATQGQGSPKLGPMFWETGVSRLSALEVIAR